MTLVDSAREIACEVKRLLTEQEKRVPIRKRTRHKFLVSDRPQEFQKIAKAFLGKEIKNIIRI